MKEGITDIVNEECKIKFTFKKRRYSLDKDLFLDDIRKDFSRWGRYIGIRKIKSDTTFKCAEIEGIHEPIYVIMNMLYTQGKLRALIVFVLCILSKVVYEPSVFGPTKRRIRQMIRGL